jgi:glutaredoxin
MKSVTIYTGPLCNYCEAAKRLLTRNNVEYKEIDISTVDGAMDEMIKKQMVKEQSHKFSSMINTLVVMMKQEL